MVSDSLTTLARLTRLLRSTFDSYGTDTDLPTRLPWALSRALTELTSACDCLEREVWFDRAERDLSDSNSLPQS